MVKKRKFKGYLAERKIRKILESKKWYVVRAGGSLGFADIICIKDKMCYFFQIKSSKKDVLYYNGYMAKEFEGFPFYLIVDFGYGKIKVFEPKQKIKKEEGISLDEFLEEIEKKK